MISGDELKRLKRLNGLEGLARDLRSRDQLFGLGFSLNQIGKNPSFSAVAAQAETKATSPRPQCLPRL